MASSTSEIGSAAERRAQGVVELVVSDLASAVPFYVALGFTVQRRTAGFAVMTWDEVFVFLAEDPAAPTAPRWVNLRITVPNVDRIWAQVQRLRLPIVSPVGDRSYGLRDFTVRDPFGFEVRFAQPLP
jgi:catechol 2,3-dioxygenase-like lactoylglutathione lyase family enzyme